MGVMDQPVEDSVGNRGIADLFMPVRYGKLTGDDGGGVPMSLLNNLQQVSSFSVGHGGEAEIINHQDLGIGELVDDFAVASVSLGQGHLV